MSKRSLVIRVVLSVILGMVTTVGVAWGLALLQTWGEPQGGSAWLSPRGSEVSSVYVSQVWQPGVMVRSVVSGESGRRAQFQPAVVVGDIRILEPEEVDVSWGLARRALLNGEEVAGGEEARGWPCVALYSTFTEIADPPVREGGIRVREDPVGFDHRFIPLLPIWKGIAVNTCVYGGVWLTAFVVPPLLRRMRRKRQGRCPGCGYDLHGRVDSGCSECGWGRAGPSLERTEGGQSVD